MHCIFEDISISTEKYAKLTEEQTKTKWSSTSMRADWFPYKQTNKQSKNNNKEASKPNKTLRSITTFQKFWMNGLTLTMTTVALMKHKNWKHVDFSIQLVTAKHGPLPVASLLRDEATAAGRKFLGGSGATNSRSLDFTTGRAEGGGINDDGCFWPSVAAASPRFKMEES